MRARISAGGREVELITDSDANITVQQLATEALVMWRSVASQGTQEGPAFGLQAETTSDRPPSTSAIGLSVVVE